MSSVTVLDLQPGGQQAQQELSKIGHRSSPFKRTTVPEVTFGGRMPNRTTGQVRRAASERLMFSGGTRRRQRSALENNKRNKGARLVPNDTLVNNSNLMIFQNVLNCALAEAHFISKTKGFEARRPHTKPLPEMLFMFAPRPCVS